MDWSGDNNKLVKLLLRKVIKYVPHICDLSSKAQKERWQKVAEEFFKDDFAVDLKEVHYKPDSSHKIMSRRYKVEEKLVSRIFGLDTGKPMNLSCFTGDVTEVVSLMKTCLLLKNEAVTLRDSQKEQKVNLHDI